MPQIPGLESQVQTNAFAPVTRTERYDASDFGGDLGAGLQNLAGQLGQIGAERAAKKKKDADATAIMEADRKISEWENRNLYDAETGGFNVLGKDAMGLPERLLPDLDKTISEIETGLANDDQKIAFRRMAIARRSDVDRGLENHISKQIQVYEEQENQAYVDNAIEAAAANYENPERIATEIDRIEMAYTARAARTNEAPDVTKRLIEDATSKAHVGVINRMLGQGRYSWAKEYMKANKDDISATVIDEVEKAVRTGTIREESQDHADTIMAKNPKDRTAALADARKINDPEVQEATVDQINQRYNEINQAREETRRNLINDAQQLISNGGTVNDIPPGQWNQLTKEDRANLRALQERGEWYQDDKRWYDFMQTDPEVVAKMNLYTEVRPYVDDQHWDMALRMKQSILDSKKGNSTDYTTTLNFQERLKNSMVENGVFDADIISGGKAVTDSEKERYARIESEASMALAAFETEKARKATPQEQERIIDEIALKQVYVARPWQTDKQKLAVEIQEDEYGKVYVPIKNIPKAEQVELRNLAQSYGRAATEDKIERAYGAALMGDAAAVRAIMAE